MLLFAQATPAPADLKAWLEVFFFLIGIAAAVLGCLVYIKQLRAPATSSTMVTPQPFEVRAAQQFQTVEHCREFHERVTREQKELAEKFDTELGRERGGRKELHGNVTELKADIAELRAATSNLATAQEEVREDLRETRDRIDLIPQRMVEMLRNTKGLIQ